MGPGPDCRDRRTGLDWETNERVRLAMGIGFPCRGAAGGFTADGFSADGFTADGFTADGFTADGKPHTTK